MTLVRRTRARYKESCSDTKRECSETTNCVIYCQSKAREEAVASCLETVAMAPMVSV